MIIVSIFDQPSTICWQLGLQFGNCCWQNHCRWICKYWNSLTANHWCNLDRPILVHSLRCRPLPTFADLCRSLSTSSVPLLHNYPKLRIHLQICSISTHLHLLHYVHELWLAMFPPNSGPISTFFFIVQCLRDWWDLCGSSRVCTLNKTSHQPTIVSITRVDIDMLGRQLRYTLDWPIGKYSTG